MKKFRFLAVALAAMTLASCSKETENVSAPEEKIVPAVMNISLAGGITRAAGMGTGGVDDVTDSKVNHYMIYVFDGSGALVTSTAEGATKFPLYVDAETGAVAKLQVTTAARSIYVVANAGVCTAPTGEAALVIPTTNPLYLASNTETNLQDIILDSKEDAAVFASANVIMSGSTRVINFSDAAIPEATVTVNLSFPFAKITVKILDSRTGNGTVAGANKPGAGVMTTTIVDEKVGVLFAGSKIPLFNSLSGGAAQNIHTEFYSSAVNYPAYTGLGTFVTLETALFSDVVAPEAAWTTISNDSPVLYQYYVAANDPALGGTVQSSRTGGTVVHKKGPRPTIFMIQSTKETTGASDLSGLNKKEDIYYPVRFFESKDEGKDGGRGVLAVATEYAVQITLKGAINNGEGGGVLSPESDEPVANMNVTVKPAAWLFHVVPVTFE